MKTATKKKVEIKLYDILIGGVESKVPAHVIQSRLQFLQEKRARQTANFKAAMRPYLEVKS